MNEVYTQKSVRDWCHRTMGIDAYNKSNGEVRAECPRCGGTSFYFNVKKLLGFCHSASCQWSVSLDDLIKHYGFGPNQGGVAVQEPEAPVHVGIPGIPVLFYQNGQLWCSYEEAYRYLAGRGLADQTILNWGITCDGRRVYVPIRDEAGKLVNFNSRVLPSCENSAFKKYLYFPGAKTSHYILGWAECKHWNTLTLVENTFVSLAYRSIFNCSTTFGSSISEEQIEMIATSKIKTVCLLWDEGANAEKYVKRLGKAGVNAACWRILGQPDHYPLATVRAWQSHVLESARRGDFSDAVVDLTEECRNVLPKI